MTAPARAVAVVGLGLVGGSVARALVEAGLDVVGVDPDARTRAAARDAGIRALRDVEELADRALDVVVLAVPLRAMRVTALALAPVLGAAATLTDVGSVKGPVREAVAAAGLGARFVGAHPMAGTEHSGFAASSAALARGARWAVTLDDETAPDALARVLGLVTGPLAGSASVLTDDAHDEAVALVSHVPHVVATELLSLVASTSVRDVALGLAAGSYRDGTRVGRTDPRRTEAMVTQNAAWVAPALRLAARDLERLALALEENAPVAEFFDGPDAVRDALTAIDGERAARSVPSTVDLPLAGEGWRAALLARCAAGGVVVGTRTVGADDVLAVTSA